MQYQVCMPQIETSKLQSTDRDEDFHAKSVTSKSELKAELEGEHFLDKADPRCRFL